MIFDALVSIMPNDTIAGMVTAIGDDGGPGLIPTEAFLNVRIRRELGDCAGNDHAGGVSAILFTGSATS